LSLSLRSGTVHDDKLSTGSILAGSHFYDPRETTLLQITPARVTLNTNTTHKTQGTEQNDHKIARTTHTQHHYDATQHATDTLDSHMHWLLSVSITTDQPSQPTSCCRVGEACLTQDYGLHLVHQFLGLPYLAVRMHTILLGCMLASFLCA